MDRGGWGRANRVNFSPSSCARWHVLVWLSLASVLHHPKLNLGAFGGLRSSINSNRNRKLPPNLEHTVRTRTNGHDAQFASTVIIGLFKGESMAYASNFRERRHDLYQRHTEIN